MKKCPFCAEEIQDAAVKCKHCGSALPDANNRADSTVRPSRVTVADARNFGSTEPSSQADSHRARLLVPIGIVGSVVVGAMALGPLLPFPQFIIGLLVACCGCTWFGLAFSLKGSAAMRWGGGLVIALMISVVAPGFGMLAWTVLHGTS